MKKLLAIMLVLGMSSVYASAEVKKVCHSNPKTKKEVCKNVKVHKKVEGTKVPEPKKKK